MNQHEPPELHDVTGVAVLSDVHGNAVALEAVLKDVQRESANLIVFGGDLTWGPLPNQTLALLRDLPAPALYVRGNAERALLEPPKEPTERETWMLGQHTADDLAFLQTFVQQAVVEISGLGCVRFCHGSPRSDEECVTPATPVERVREFAADVHERVIVTAHTHLQFDRKVAGIRSINPGSVGLPYEGRSGAFWALLGPGVQLRETTYDLDSAVDRYRKSGDPLAELMVDMLLNPATRDEVIEHAEAVTFSD
jgi:putative phosphoesterase